MRKVDIPLDLDSKFVDSRYQLVRSGEPGIAGMAGRFVRSLNYRIMARIRREMQTVPIDSKWRDTAVQSRHGKRSVL